MQAPAIQAQGVSVQKRIGADCTPEHVYQMHAAMMSNNVNTKVAVEGRSCASWQIIAEGVTWFQSEVICGEAG